MSLPDELLNPIGGPNPCGTSLRYDPIFDKIKEARREEDQAPPGMTDRDRKVADNSLVIKLASEALGNRTKDLQLAAWLTEALLKQRGFGGLRDGLNLVNVLVTSYWDSVYPELEDGDPQTRAAPLGFIGTKLDIVLKLVPIVEGASYNFLDYEQSREVGYEELAKSDEAKKRRAQSIKEGKLAPELFDKAFEQTTKKFYAQAEQDLDAILQALAELRKNCDAKFAEDGPMFGPLQSALEAVRHAIHAFLQKKREIEPDPIEPVPASTSGEEAQPAAQEAEVNPPAGVLISLENSSELPERLEAVQKIAQAAAQLRRREPKSPASFLMLRGLRWGELRAAVDRGDPTVFEAPPTQLRKHLKRLALEKKWEKLLESAENAMALPCSRAWLDLQRLVVEACEGLGSGYEAIARAIRSELKALVGDIPQLLDATLIDDTPAANSETRGWLKTFCDFPASQAPTDGSTNGSALGQGSASAWPAHVRDGYASALQALREGQERVAFEIMQQDIARQRSGRERFRRKLQLVDLCQSTGKQIIAQPILDDLAAAVEAHKLDDWEDPALVASALSTIMKLSQRLQADKAQQQKLFERICRLDAAQALGNGK